jgi:hypothetical protein
MNRLRFDLKTVSALITALLTLLSLYLANRINVAKLQERVHFLEHQVESLETDIERYHHK